LARKFEAKGRRESRQQVIATLGRIDELQVRGQWERLLRSGARFAAKSMMLRATAVDAAIKVTRRWCSSGYGRNPAAGQRLPQLAGAWGTSALVRAVFVTVPAVRQRLPTDRGSLAPGLCDCGRHRALHHLCRPMAWLDGRTTLHHGRDRGLFAH